MKFLAAVGLLVLALTLSPHVSSADESEGGPNGFDSEEFGWAYGQLVDSITVSGNKRTKAFVILREMETRAGDRLYRQSLERDHRYLNDLSSFARVDIEVEFARPGACNVRVHVTERPTLLLRLIYPVLEYDFNRERLRYGVKWSDRNFRWRLESFSFDATRDSDDNDNVSLGWATRWIGWKHIGANGRVSYFHRSDVPTDLNIIEQVRVAGGISLPLTDSRIAFTQVLGGLSLAKNRLGQSGLPAQDEYLVSPTVGFLYDGRDSPLRPQRGSSFFVSVQTSRVVNGPGSTYYRLTNDIRFFRPINDFTVLGLHSNLGYQFGEFPEYIRFGLGGAGTLRGYSDGVFISAHRWIQSAEVRVSPLPRVYFRLPFAGLVDIRLSLVFFVDTGITWRNESDFALDNFHGGFGYGLRLYSPFQDVVRFDLGYTLRGEIKPYVSTGIRF